LLDSASDTAQAEISLDKRYPMDYNLEYITGMNFRWLNPEKRRCASESFPTNTYYACIEPVFIKVS
jgi:hypothetical protein